MTEPAATPPVDVHALLAAMGIAEHNHYTAAGYQWPYKNPNPKVHALTVVLDAAYHEMLGQGQVWKPPAVYTYTLRPQWATPAGRQELVSYLDSEFIDELTKNKFHWAAKGITTHPQFYRLTDEQRAGLCFMLHEVLLAYPDPIEDYDPALAI